MATSVYFNNYNSQAEQRVVEDLIVESIKIMGFDAYYLPIFNEDDRDILYGEDPVKKFKQAFPVEFYLSSSLEYMGEKEFFSKFGLEIKNNVNVIVSKRAFEQNVLQNDKNNFTYSYITFNYLFNVDYYGMLSNFSYRINLDSSNKVQLSIVQDGCLK